MQMNGNVLKNGLKLFTTVKYLSIDFHFLASYLEKIKLLEMILFFCNYNNNLFWISELSSSKVWST